MLNRTEQAQELLKKYNYQELSKILEVTSFVGSQMGWPAYAKKFVCVIEIALKMSRA